MSEQAVSLLILGTAEWSAPIATNQHYVVRELASSARVWFGEGVGTRSLTLSWADARRVGRRLLRRRSAADGGDRAVPPGVEVVRLRMLPWQFGPAAVINRRLLRAQTAGWWTRPGVRVLWSFTPYTYGLERSADRVVYHLVDLLHENPGVVAGRLTGAERRLARSTDVAIGTSPAVALHLRDAGFANVLTRPNVADTRVFEAAAATVPKSDLPRLVFVGALNPGKIDLGLLEALAQAVRGEATVSLMGPMTPQFSALQGPLLMAGVEVLAAGTIDAAARLVASGDIGLIPYKINALTQGITPLKTYEYFAAGLAVLATPLPGLPDATDDLVIRPADEWVSAVGPLLRRAREPLAVKARQELARNNDWAVRGEEYRGLLAAWARP